MSCGIGIFRPECGTKSVDFCKTHSCQFSLQLTRNCQIGLSTEEVLFVIDFSFLCQWKVLKVQCGHFKSLPSSFCIGSGDDWSMYIEEARIVEVLVPCKRQRMPYPENSAKRGGSNP